MDELLRRKNDKILKNFNFRFITPWRKIVFNFKSEGVVSVLDHFDDLFMFESHCFDAVYRENDIANLELVGSEKLRFYIGTFVGENGFLILLGNASRFEVANSGFAVFVATTCTKKVLKK